MGGNVPAPTKLPPPVKQIAYSVQRPYVIVCAGQSNAAGQDHSGSKTVGTNIWITNDKAAPTALIAAQFGINPLNVAVGGTTTDPSLAYNNQGVASANALRASGALTDDTPIIIVPDWEPSKSISNWIDPVGTDAYTVLDMWARLQAQLAVVVAAYPQAKIDFVIWAQGENDSGGSTSYGSKSLYLSAFARLIAKFQSLPQWAAQSRISVSELGTWSNNSGGQARNDALRSLPGLYSFVSLASSQGLAESTDNPGPHFDGVSLVALGQRHFANSPLAGLAGLNPADRTAYGSALAFPNDATLPATGTSGAPYPINPDDIRSGGRFTLTGGYVQLPGVTNARSYPVVLYVTAQTTIVAQGTLYAANTSGAQSLVTIKAGERWEAVQHDGTSWMLHRRNIAQGNQQRFTSGGPFTGTVTFASTQLSGVAYTLGNGATAATATITPTFGLDAVFAAQGATASTIALASGTFADGSTTSLTLQPGQEVWLLGRINGTNGLVVDAIYDSGVSSAATQRDAPASGATVTSKSGVGHLTHVIDPAATIAALTVTLPTSPRDGSRITYVPTQNVTAVTFSGGTLGIAQTSFTAGQRLALAYVASQSKWF